MALRGSNACPGAHFLSGDNCWFRASDARSNGVPSAVSDLDAYSAAHNDADSRPDPNTDCDADHDSDPYQHPNPSMFASAQSTGSSNPSGYRGN